MVLHHHLAKTGGSKPELWFNGGGLELVINPSPANWGCLLLRVTICGTGLKEKLRGKAAVLRVAYKKTRPIARGSGLEPLRARPNLDSQSSTCCQIGATTSHDVSWSVLAPRESPPKTKWFGVPCEPVARDPKRMDSTSGFRSIVRFVSHHGVQFRS